MNASISELYKTENSFKIEHTVPKICDPIQQKVHDVDF